MSCDIHHYNTKPEITINGVIRNADIITVDLDSAAGVMNVVYRVGFSMHCVICTSFRCVECGAPEFYPMRTVKKKKGRNNIKKQKTTKTDTVQLTNAYLRLVTYQRTNKILVRSRSLVEGRITKISINKILNKIAIKYLYRWNPSMMYCNYFIVLDNL